MPELRYSCRRNGHTPAMATLDPLLVYSVVVIAVVQTIGLILRLAGRP